MTNSLIIMIIISSVMALAFNLLLFKGILEKFKFKRERLYYASLIINFSIFLTLQLIVVLSVFIDKNIDFPLWASFLPLMIFLSIPCSVLAIIMTVIMQLNDEDLKQLN